MQKSFLFDIANIFVDNLFSAKTSAFIVVVSAVFAAVVVGSVAVVVVVVVVDVAAAVMFHVLLKNRKSFFPDPKQTFAEFSRKKTEYPQKRKP